MKTKSQKRKKHGWSATVSAVDKDVVTRAWLKKNAEVCVMITAFVVLCPRPQGFRLGISLLLVSRG